MRANSTVLSDADKALLRFACCTYTLKRTPPKAPSPPKVTSPPKKPHSSPARIIPPKPVLPPPACPPPRADKAIPSAPTTSVLPVRPVHPSRPLTDVLLDMAAEVLYAKASAAPALNTEKILRLAFISTNGGLIPTASCEKILLFWCDFLLMGLRGEYDGTSGWGHAWRCVLECVDALILNYSMAFRRNPTKQQRVAMILDKLSEACLDNKCVGKPVLEWAIELAAQLAAP
ncbi:Aste57867_15053 [Aphanomyces stellatus]|uniref:Aste57867_15053 protein n=1 Tax=Aphanomyces stellatus TaxID=120398 RepID=A0A485L415_9STRA|nr:hypothetical protein As57867_014997 [Aphanomyces stellatus]VFT91867.1 Aste57867_15053 [Aphanomyces stellatus]